MHFRDLLIIADGYAKEVLASPPTCKLTPPLAFTFGLGGLAVFLRGAAAALLEQVPTEHDRDYPEAPGNVLPPRPRLPGDAEGDGRRGGPVPSSRGGQCRRNASRSLRGLMAKTGKPMLDGIGATEMLHIFITNR